MTPHGIVVINAGSTSAMEALGGATLQVLAGEGEAASVMG